MPPLRWARAPERNPAEWAYIEKGLIWLCGFVSNLTDTGSMIEVGAYSGESAVTFSHYFEKVHCVDHWNDPIDAPDPGSVERSFDQRMGASAGKIVKHRAVSPQGADLFADGSYDFVYVDADHHHDPVLADIRAWWPKLRPGRFFGGHDYNNPGVASAVAEFLGGSPYAHGLVTFPDFSWIVWKP
jgi:cephalosporin hydroxylase